jgi:hypothetical protein
MATKACAGKACPTPYAFRPKTNKHWRRQALGSGIGLQGSDHGDNYIAVAAPKGVGETHHTNNISHSKNKLSHEKVTIGLWKRNSEFS